MRNVRQRAAIWKQHQPRPQCQPSALECEPASGKGGCERRIQARAGLHFLPEVRQGREGVGIEFFVKGPPDLEALSFLPPCPNAGESSGVTNLVPRRTR